MSYYDEHSNLNQQQFQQQQPGYTNLNQQQYQPQQYQQSYNQVDPKLKQDADMSMIFFILGFFIGLLWIVNYCIYSNSPSEDARKWAKWSLYVFLFLLCLNLCVFVFAFGSMMVSVIIMVAGAAARVPPKP